MNRRRASALPAFSLEQLDHLESAKGATNKKRSSIDVLTAKLKSKLCHGSSPNVESVEDTDDDDEGTSTPRDTFQTPTPFFGATFNQQEAWVPKKEKRSLSLTVTSSPFRASSASALDETDERRVWKRNDSKEYYRRRASQQYQAAMPIHYGSQGSWSAEEMQRTIIKAKAEAKTVSVVNGCLYINYEYIGPLPDGCIV